MTAMAAEKPVRVLSVDDEEGYQALLASIFKRNNWDYKFAGCGKEALEKVKAWSPDLIFLDLMLPDINGFEVCSQIKSDPATQHIPVIMITGLADNDSKIKGLNAGANDFIAKPFDVMELMIKANNLLKLKEFEELKLKNEILTEMFKAIEAAKKDWELTLNCLEDIVLLVDKNEKILRCNRILLTLTGKSYAELLYRNWPEVLQENGFRQISSGSNQGEFSHPLGKWFLYYSYSVKEAEGTNIAKVITLKDITERKIIEGQLVQSQKLEAIGHLAAGIAHEINTPIQYVGDNTRFLMDAFKDLHKLLEVYDNLAEAGQSHAELQEILTNVALLKKEIDLPYLREEIPKAIKQSLEGVERVGKIVRAMKEFSHPGPKEKTPTNLNKAIENTVTVARNEWKYVSEMILDLDPDLPLVPCHPNEFNQVILNLVINAAHAIADVVGNGATNKGKITVSTRRKGDKVEISVKDTGTGIPPEIRSKIFDPFFTTKEVGKGTGQGLAIARSIVVDKHGGTIDFETEVGKGTTFTIYLPIGNGSK